MQAFSCLRRQVPTSAAHCISTQPDHTTLPIPAYRGAYGTVAAWIPNAATTLIRYCRWMAERGTCNAYRVLDVLPAAPQTFHLPRTATFSSQPHACARASLRGGAARCRYIVCGAFAPLPLDAELNVDTFAGVAPRPIIPGNTPPHLPPLRRFSSTPAWTHASGVGWTTT